MANQSEIQEVNVALGDDMSKMLDTAARLTYENIPDAVWRSSDGFRAIRGIDGSLFAKHISSLVFMMGFDGIGTKVEVHERMQDHTGAAFDLLAMVCDDAPRYGAQVISWGSVLDTGKLDKKDPLIMQGMKDLATSMVLGSKEAGIVAINGEIAELIGRVVGHGTFNYNWGAGVMAVVHKDRALTGEQLEAGQALVGLPELGPRCNGLTDIREQLKAHHEDDWHTKVVSELGELTLGEIVSRPATIYHGLMTKLTGGWNRDIEGLANVTGFAHVTGGGQPSKIGTMLQDTELGAIIYDPIRPPDLFPYVQKLAGFSDRKSYGKWHMGPGGIVATTQPDEVIEAARAQGIEGAKVIGEITDNPVIRIKNQGAIQDEEWLDFPLAS